MKRNEFIIYGAGGHGKVVLDILLESEALVAGFVDGDENKAGQNVCGLQVFGNLTALPKKRGFAIALGIGNNKIREKTYREVKAAGFKIISAIHPRAFVSRFAKMREGVVIMAGAVVNPGALIEVGAVVNTGATVDHDCHLGRFCQVWPGANLAGSVRVGAYSYVGTGASVIPGRMIGEDVMIGAGAAVVSDIPDRVVAKGVPARTFKRGL